MKKLYYFVVSFVLIFPIFVLAAEKTQTQAPGERTQTQAPDVVLTNPLAADSIPAILNRIIDFMLIVAGPIAVIMTIYAAYLFITAGDNQERVKTARKTLMYVIIGVAILILSKGIVSLSKSFLEVPEETLPVEEPVE